MPVETARKILHDFLKHFDDLKVVRRPQTNEEDDDEDVHDGFEEEFLRLKDESGSFGNEGAYASLAGKLEYNRKKNRYKDILPYDLSRVKLRELEGVAGSDYINASFIKGVTRPREYIAAQAPLPHTLNDFWRMIVEQKVVVIVMAANEREGTKVKCERYWPEVGEEKTFGDVSVSLVNEEWHNHYFVERLMCAKWQPAAQKSTSGASTARRTSQQQAPCERRIVQYHYVAWPDHGIPSPNASIAHFVELVRHRQQELLRELKSPTANFVDADPAPLLVHCSAGCGRTGTVIAIDYVQQLLDTRRQTGSAEVLADFSVYNLALDLRKQRNAMIQTKDQYVVVFNAVAELARDTLAELGGPASRGARAVTPPPKPALGSTAAAAVARKTQPEAGLNDMDDLIASLSLQQWPPSAAARGCPPPPLQQPSSPKGRVAAAVATLTPTSLPLSANSEPAQQQASSSGSEGCDSSGKPAWPPAVVSKNSPEATHTAQQGPAATGATASNAAAARTQQPAYENVELAATKPPRTKRHKSRSYDTESDSVPTVSLLPRCTQSVAPLAGEAAAPGAALAAAVTPTRSDQEPPLSPLPHRAHAADAGRPSKNEMTGRVSPVSPVAEQRPPGSFGRSPSPHVQEPGGDGSMAVTWRKAYNTSAAGSEGGAALPGTRPSASGVKLHRAHAPVSPLARRAADPAATAASGGLHRSLTLQPRLSVPAQPLPHQPPAIGLTSPPAAVQAAHPAAAPAGASAAAGPALMSALAQEAAKVSRAGIAGTAAELRLPVADATAAARPPGTGASSSSGGRLPVGGEGVYMELEPLPTAAAARLKAASAAAAFGAVATSSNDGGSDIAAGPHSLPPDGLRSAAGSASAQAPRPPAPGCRPLPALPGANDGGPLTPPLPQTGKRPPIGGEYVYVDLYSVNKWSLQHIARGSPVDDATGASSYSIVDDDSSSSSGAGDAPPVVPPKTAGAYCTDDVGVPQPERSEGSSALPGPPPKPKLQSTATADLTNLQSKVKGLFQPSKKPSISDTSTPATSSLTKEDILYHGVNISYPNVVGKPKGPKGMPLQWKQAMGDSMPFPRET